MNRFFNKTSSSTTRPFALVVLLAAFSVYGLVQLAGKGPQWQQAWLAYQQRQIEAERARLALEKARAHAALVAHIEAMDFYEAPAAAASHIARFARARGVADLATGSLPDFKRAAALSVPLLSEEVARAVEVYAQAQGVPVMLARALVHSESGYQPWVSNKGAQGLMQIKLLTARTVGYDGDEQGLLDPLTNLEYGMRHLARVYRLANGDPCRTIAIYRTGNPQARPSSSEMAVCIKSRG